MTALQPARPDPPQSHDARPHTPSPPSTPTRNPTHLPHIPHLPLPRIPFPLVDEISRHCLEDDEPETVHIEVHLPGRLDHERLRTAFHQALARHPRVLMRQVPTRWWHRHYTWQLTPTPDVDPVAFPPPGPDALARARTRALTDCPPLDAAPPVRLEVIEPPHTTEDNQIRVNETRVNETKVNQTEDHQPPTTAGTVLLLTVHHTALDGPACLRILATAAELYGGTTPSPAPTTAPTPTPHPEPPAPPPHYRPRPLTRPARLAPDHTTPTPTPTPTHDTTTTTNAHNTRNTPHTHNEPTRQHNGTPPARTPHHNEAPAENEAPPAPQTTRPEQATHPERSTHPARSTCPGNGMLLTELPIPTRPPHPTTDTRPPYTVNDQLLVATYLMATCWNELHARPTAPVVITMPIDDRPRGPHMPIGNGTRLTPVPFPPPPTAPTAPPAPLTALLHQTAARTRALKSTPPGSQLGLPATLLTSLPLPIGARRALTRALRSLATPWTPTTLLSNIGRIPYPLDFGDTGGRATAVWFSAPARMPRGLSITTASTHDGNRIHLALRWSRALLDDAAAAHLLALFRSSLAATAYRPPDGAAPRPEAGTP
ncbi:condensation protein [Streptomyces sp. RGM 3693]|uniref:condensation protein n=1 Tax=Streptomyces sp. RGM 3693 TaxID=3413284 RepID=UPI003D2D0289